MNTKTNHQKTQFILDGLKIFSGEARLSRAVIQSLNSKQYERAERRLTARFLRAGDTVIECGAGMGAVSATAARILKQGRIVSLEPDPAVAQAARETLRLNGLSGEVLDYVAVPRRLDRGNKTVQISRGQDFTLNSLKRETEGEGRFEAKTIIFEDLVENVRPNFLISDIEGYEIEFLQNAQLEGIRGMVIEFHPHLTGINPIRQVLRDLETRGFYASAECSFDTSAYLFKAEKAQGLPGKIGIDPLLASLTASAALMDGRFDDMLYAAMAGLSDSNAADLYYKKGIALEHIGDIKSSAEAFTAAIECEPRVQYYHWHLNQLRI